MHRKILVAALAVLSVALLASPALAAKGPHRYSPKRGHACKKTYRQVKHHGKRFCVKRSAKKAAARAPERVKLHAHLDPTFTRDPLNPFKVTYAYSASATQEAAAATQTSASISSESPAQLPSGVLALYSDGKLECAVNVGSGVDGSECPVSYQALGVHKVTTIYTSGEQSATETEEEEIGPVATTTTLSVSYEARIPEEAEPSSGLWWIGNLSVQIGASPQAVHAALGCGAGAAGEITFADCYQLGNSAEHVYANATGNCAAPVMGDISTGESPSTRGSARMAAEALEEGTYHLRASVTASGGYSASEATTPLQFTPELELQPDC